ncbi:MAG: hypothetical protein SFZ23_11275 [Planctomycetota bacterium]|nr:hypothetical protein [Planctomycetota bacterium]
MTFAPVKSGALILALAACAPALAQNVFDDFSSGNDNTWTRIDAPDLFLGVPSTYSVENGGYRLRGPVYPNVGLNLPTASVRVDGAAANSQISVDAVDWEERQTQTIAMAARLQQVGSMAFQFYSLVFFPRSTVGAGLSNFRLDRWNADGSVSNITSNLLFPQVDPDHDFRLVFTVEGSSLRGDLYNLTLDPLNPYQTISAIDSSPLAITGIGLPGIFTTPNPGNIGLPTFGPADVTFDNFRVVPAPGAAALLGVSGLLATRRRRAR